MLKHGGVMEQKREVNPVRLEMRYALEDDFQQAITTGNRKKVEALLEYRLKMFPNPDCCPQDPATDKLRSCKNKMVSIETIFRLGARRGGVPALALYSMSSRYAVMIEESTSVQFLYQKIFSQMALEYVDLVLDLSVTGYSQAIQQVIVYICSHISEDLSLDQLSLVHRVNAAHLSRKFKQETGMTLNSYINNQRIGLAKLYLENGQHDLYDMAGRLGFSNPDYFGKVFKKITGMTLTQYARNVRIR